MGNTTASRITRLSLSLALGVLLLGGGTIAAGARSLDRTMANVQNAQPKPAEPSIVLTTLPDPAVAGDNAFEVTVTGVDGKPLVGADVSILLVMPAMPMMSMPEMRSTVALKPAEGKAAAEGKYTGRGDVPMAGRWNVTVSVKVAGKDIVEKKLTLRAR